MPTQQHGISVKLQCGATLMNDVVYGNATPVSHKAKDWEDDNAKEEAGAAVCQRDHYWVSAAVVVELIVATHCDERPKASAESEQDLHCRIVPHLQTR